MVMLHTDSGPHQPSERQLHLLFVIYSEHPQQMLLHAHDCTVHTTAAGQEHNFLAASVLAICKQEKLCALSSAVHYQDLTDATVWDGCGAMVDCTAILQVTPTSVPRIYT